MALFNIIRDTREKSGWSFTKSKNIGNIVDKKLDTGDYTIIGLEDKICIERKASTGEIANNMFQSRFKNELERMMTFRYRFLVMEFDIDSVLNFPYGSGIPRKQFENLTISPSLMMKFLCEIQVKYDIPIIYAGNPGGAEFIVDSLMKRLWEESNVKS